MIAAIFKLQCCPKKLRTCCASACDR